MTYQCARRIILLQTIDVNCLSKVRVGLWVNVYIVSKKILLVPVLDWFADPE